MEELTTTTKPAAPSPQADIAMLRQMTAELNNPALTGAKMTAEERAENERIFNAELAKAQSVENIPHEAQVQAAAAVAPRPALPTPLPAPAPQPEPVPSITEVPNRLFITGGHGSGIQQLIANLPELYKVISLRQLAMESLRATCMLQGNPPANLAQEFQDLGEGKYQLTLQNILFIGLLRHEDPSFATPGYWARRAVLAAAALSAEVRPIIVGVTTAAGMKTLQEQGYAHYHAMCSPATALQRTPPELRTANAPANFLANALDADVHRKISAQRQGKRLNVVWTDTVAAPSGRFIPEKEFKEVVLCAPSPVVGSDSLSQAL